jgi:hypothetical protein
VKGHSGVPGNSSADKLAGKAAERQGPYSAMSLAHLDEVWIFFAVHLPGDLSTTLAPDSLSSVALDDERGTTVYQLAYIQEFSTDSGRLQSPGSKGTPRCWGIRTATKIIFFCLRPANNTIIPQD